MRPRARRRAAREDADALKTILEESPIPLIADIDFNHTLALKAIDAGRPLDRLNPGNIGGREEVAEVARRPPRRERPDADRRRLRLASEHLHEPEARNPVEALARAAVEFVELMESLDFTDFKASIKSTNVPNTIGANRLLSERIDCPLHLGITEAGTKLSGRRVRRRPWHALGRWDRRRRIRSSLSTLPRRGGSQGCLGDPEGPEAQRAWPRIDRVPRPAAASSSTSTPSWPRSRSAAGLRRRDRGRRPGLRLNGIGEGSHADFGIDGANDSGDDFAHGDPLKRSAAAVSVIVSPRKIDKSVERGQVSSQMLNLSLGRGR